MSTRIATVVVTFNPRMDQLLPLLQTLLEQTQRVFVVDNASSSNWPQALPHVVSEQIHLHTNPANLGIGAAQNIGITLAREWGATHVLLCDHDSLPASDMVSQLMAALQRLEAQGQRVAAVGPCYTDERQNNPPPFLRIRGLRLQRQHPSTGEVVQVEYLIASGTLMPMPAINVVGGLNECLFLDYVDLEWGLRASHKGWHCYGVFAAHMLHRLGEEPIVFRGKRYMVHSPLRHYYMVRNALWLYRQRGINWRWKVIDFYRLVPRIAFYSLMARPRAAHFAMMMRGLRDGLLGRMGRFNSSGSDGETTA
ncbi:MAG: hypothetical protein RLZZ271_962 [Pseudomonadota bacterium]|jgi:rhamnosyltransferase